MFFVEAEKKLNIFLKKKSLTKPNKTPNIRANQFPSPVVNKMPKKPV